MSEGGNLYCIVGRFVILMGAPPRSRACITEVISMAVCKVGVADLLPASVNYKDYHQLSSPLQRLVNLIAFALRSSPHIHLQSMYSHVCVPFPRAHSCLPDVSIWTTEEVFSRKRLAFKCVELLKIYFQAYMWVESDPGHGLEQFIQGHTKPLVIGFCDPES